MALTPVPHSQRGGGGRADVAVDAPWTEAQQADLEDGEVAQVITTRSCREIPACLCLACLPGYRGARDDTNRKFIASEPGPSPRVANVVTVAVPHAQPLIGVSEVLWLEKSQTMGAASKVAAFRPEHLPTLWRHKKRASTLPPHKVKGTPEPAKTPIKGPRGAGAPSTTALADAILASSSTVIHF